MTRYTREERDQIGRAAYDAMHVNDASGPWESLSPDRGWFWRQAGIAAVTEADRINHERMDRWKQDRRSTKRIA